MADAPETNPIQNAYAQRFANDLVDNRKEQEEITGQIAALQKRLDQLSAEAAWLTQAQASLTTVLAPSAPVAAVATHTPHTVPQPRQDQREKAAQAKQPAKKTDAKKKTTTRKTAAKKAIAKKTATELVPAPQALAKKTTKKAAAKKIAVKKSSPAREHTSTETPTKQTTTDEKSGPPLWALIRDILLKTPGQPCMAREVTDQLSQAHPTRATSIQMVRNSLETLVKKNLAEKSRQQGNAMYTAYTDASTPPIPAANEPASSEDKQTPQVEAEKVTAKA
ncbi:hypothetical protein ABZX38_32850 [Streptomyces longwoodensis]|uniref:hypothetical protein n=1 Tax=Streptomyces longwoodensis TaxID=68231 RepID=UPI0033AE3A24